MYRLSHTYPCPDLPLQLVKFPGILNQRRKRARQFSHAGCEVDNKGRIDPEDDVPALDCDSFYLRYVWAYNDAALLHRYRSPSRHRTALRTCIGSITVEHVAGGVSPATKTVTYGLATNILGEASKCWITSNLGADHQASDVGDTTEASAA